MMYQETELKTTVQDDSDSSDNSSTSFSYPYSRFTLAGKRKSRLGTHSRFTQHSVNNEEKKTKEGAGSDKRDATAPQTPSWLRADSQSSTLPMTPGEGLFRHTQTPSNENGINVSSQSNFVNSLKSEPMQTLNFKKRLAFDNTPFKAQVLKESNSLFKTPGKINHHLDTNVDHKKDTLGSERKFENVKNKENTFDTPWNQLKQICDNGVLQASTENNDQSSGGFGCNIVRPDQSNPDVFLAPRTIPLQQQKDEDDISNTPLDLSCGENLHRKNLYKRNSSSGSELTGDSCSVPNSGSLTSEYQAKDNVYCSDNRGKQTSQDLLSTILPEFMVATKKVQAKNSLILDDPNEMPSKLDFVKQPSLGPKTVAPVIKEPANPFIVPPKLKVSDSQQFCKSEDALFKLNKVKDATLLQIPNSKTEINQPSLMSNRFQGPNFPPVKTENAPGQRIISSSKATAKFESFSAKLTEQNYETDNLSGVKVSPPSNVSETFSTFEVEIKDEKDLLEKLAEKKAYSKLIQQGKREVPEAKALETQNPQQPSATSLKPTRGVVLASPKLKIKDQIPSESGLKSSLDDVKDDLVLPSFSSLSLGENAVRKNDHIFKEYENSHMPAHSSMNVFQQSSDSSQTNPSLTLQDKNAAPSSNFEQVNVFVDQQPNSLQKSVEIRPAADPNLQPQGQVKVEQLPQQKTFLVPQPPTSRKPASNFNSQEVGRRQNFVPMQRFPNSFNFGGSRGNSSNSELFVNGKTYSVLSMLGRGGSSEVYQVLDPNSSKLLAVKCVDLSSVDRTIADGYLNEIDLLSKLQGTCSVIRMFDYEYIQDSKILYVVMEKGDTDLSQLIRDINKTKKISMSMIIYYWTEILTAVNDIHHQGIIHSDLKPANFLLVSGRLKLIDFGIASSQGDMTSVVKEVTTGTWNYMSPEALRNTSATGKGYKITYKSDVWSLGCILYNLVYGKTPFSHINHTWAKLQAITDPTHHIEFPDVGAPSVLMSALRQCLRREPASRPTVAQLLALPYHNPTDVASVGQQVEGILAAAEPRAWDLIKHLFPRTTEGDA